MIKLNKEQIEKCPVMSVVARDFGIEVAEDIDIQSMSDSGGLSYHASYDDSDKLIVTCSDTRARVQETYDAINKNKLQRQLKEGK